LRNNSTQQERCHARKNPDRQGQTHRDRQTVDLGRRRDASGPQEVGRHAVILLIADHHAVDKLFKQYEQRKDKGSSEEKRALAEKICLELTVHTIIEEKIFYPEVREAVKNSDEMFDEAEVEHTTLKQLIAAIKKAAPDDTLFDANVKVLGEYVKHHVEEEHEDMFPKARKSKLGLEAIGITMAARKAALMEGKLPQ